MRAGRGRGRSWSREDARGSDDRRPGQQQAQKAKTVNVKKARKELIASELGYKDESNPFGDATLTDKFVWRKKNEYLQAAGLHKKSSTDREISRMETKVREIHAVKKRRDEREVERQLLEKQREEHDRERHDEEYDEWKSKEEKFHLENAKARSMMRIEQGRERPIDLVAKALMIAEGEEFEDMSLLDKPPHQLFVQMGMDEVESVAGEIETFIKTDLAHRAFWKAMLVVGQDALEQKQREKAGGKSGEFGAGVAEGVASEIHELLCSKGRRELEDMLVEIKSSISKGSEGMDTQFFDAVAAKIPLYVARAEIELWHRKGMDKAEAWKKAHAPDPLELAPPTPEDEEDEAPKGGGMWDDLPSGPAAGDDLSPVLEPLSALDEEAAKGAFSPVLEPLKDFDPQDLLDPEEDERIMRQVRQTIRNAFASEPGGGGSGSADGLDRSAEDDMVNRERNRGFGDGESGFNAKGKGAGDDFHGELDLPKKHYEWEDKYKPRMFEYPEMDDSLEAWVQMISSDVDAYLTTKTTASMEALVSELGRFGSFYDGSPYGPFDVCYGKGIAHSFTCKKSVLPLPFTSVFHAPRRRASIMEIVDGDVQVFYDMSGVAQMEAAMNIGVIVFLILVMIGFSIVLSYSITEIALMPLERMLSVVRSRCAEIFKYTADLNQSGGDQPDDSRGAAASDASAASEFVLLEKAVSKLAAIVHLSAKPTEPDVNDELTEDAVMVLNWTQGQNAVVIQQAVSDTGSASGRTSSGRTSFVASSGRRQTIRSHASSTMTPRRRATLRQSTRAGKRASLDRTSLISIVEEETEHKMKIAETMAAHVPLETTKSLHGPDFDAFDTSFSSEMQVGLVLYIFYITPGACDYVQASVDKEVMQKFVVKAQEGYSPNKFHNFAHALDVAYEVSTKIRLVEAGRFMYEVGTQQFWLLVAALGLDLGHVGVNNQFLIETKHELAVTYNDKSPLENLHCSMLFQILSNDDANVLKFLDKDGYREARKFIIDAILHTDVVKHSEMVKALSLLYQMNTAFFPARGWSEDTNEVLTSQAQLASNALLHLSDVGNPTKRWPAARRLAMLSMEEFFLQGDQEKALGFPVSMLNDRDKVNLPSSQIGFIEFMVLPLVEAMVHIFPALCDRAKNLERNTQEWRDLWIGEDGHNEVAVEKMSTRVQKVQQRCSEVYKSPEPVASPRNAMRRQEVNMSLGLLLPSDADPL